MRYQSKWLVGVALAATFVAGAQDVIMKITGGTLPKLAVPDFRGAGESAPFMDVFNKTLFSDLDNSGLFTMAAKSFYPLEVPQRPEDFRPPLPPVSSKKGTPGRPARQGPWLTDWSGPPVDATHLAFGYAAAQDGQIVLSGWLFDVRGEVSGAQLLGKRYFGPLNGEGARKVAHEFAADIIATFHGTSLLGSKVYFVSDRTGFKEIWSMDPDGSNQKPFTSYKSISITPACSPDGTKLAFTTYARGNPGIFVHSLETGRRLPFFSPNASMNATPGFTPDGQRVLYSSTVSGGYAQIYIANADGGQAQRLTQSRAIEVEPKASPKGGEVVFVSGRSGMPQIYKMSLDGASAERLTTGEGEATNPAWHPNGQVIAFSWTRGFEPGNYNVFIMDVATRRFDQLTHGAGKNENPTWAPDGRHIVFASTRSGSSQIWTMLADGTRLQRLTTQGRNTMPVWVK